MQISDSNPAITPPPILIACRASSQIEADRIQFHGRAAPEQMQPLLRMSGIEGLPVALLEAMADKLVHHECTSLLMENDLAQAASAWVRFTNMRPARLRGSLQR